MKSLFLVMLGGGLGAGLRYLLSRLFYAWEVGAFPVATLVANVAGGLAMGLLVGLLARYADTGGNDVRLFLGVGLLGGFTTFSAFSIEAVNMIERGQWMAAGSYALVSVIASIAAVFAGLALVRTTA